MPRLLWLAVCALAALNLVAGAPGDELFRSGLWFDVASNAQFPDIDLEGLARAERERDLTLGANDRIGLVAQQLLSGGSANAVKGANSTNKRPNIIFILTDDLDQTMGSVRHLKAVQEHLVKGGTSFENHMVSQAICCPSRVSILRGQYSHNTNFTSINPPFGGYERFLDLGLHKSYLPLWMRDAGYQTAFIGKFINGFGLRNFFRVPPGWDAWEPLVLPWLYDYSQPVFSRDGSIPRVYPNLHQTDVLAAKTYAMIRDALNPKRGNDKPLFFYVAPMAPHSAVSMPKINTPFTPMNNPEYRALNFQKMVGRVSAPIPNPKYAYEYSELHVPRDIPSFNHGPDPKKPSWLKNIPVQDQAHVDNMDFWYRQRVRSVQSVDEMVQGIVDLLTELRELDNTYIFLTSDNGFHLGQWGLGAGKMTGYDSDIRVPMFVRGPGVKKNHKVHEPSTHHDVAPTILKLAGGPLYEQFDGKPMPVKDDIQTVSTEAHAVEFWDNAVREDAGIIVPKNNYKGIRLLNKFGDSFYYSVWCTGEREFYNMTTDPHQMRNAIDEAPQHLLDRLDGLMSVLKSCVGITCRHPWNVLHPDGSVENIRDAMSSAYDEKYARMEKPRFTRCVEGYIPDSETPVPPKSPVFLGQNVKVESYFDWGRRTNIGKKGPVEAKG
ncbi:hypothetical protein SmJEL517_g05759 [Synchytrium microbalum]|uniref:Sulfatase N-terminal domain-containing protein n=1 Tax=Synchytrium microbalum TaxID=1806994 RepID=A0A507BUU0_9FUNG|nr:uncharacterized protein SmJEL517_g05759 [Synchytrium microbalum]TPX30749.1 hypothetical protein SmJEL517_g05759 [Synchytrium microbalum]